MTDLIILVIFFGGVSFGVIATLIYWPWLEPKILNYDEDDDHE